MTLNIEELIGHYVDGEPSLPLEVQQIVEWTRQAAHQGRALEVLSGLRQLRQFHDGAAKSAS